MKKIIGIYSSAEASIEAIEELKRQGHPQDSISVIAKNPEKYDEVARDVGEIDNEAQAKGPTGLGAFAAHNPDTLGGLFSGLGVLANAGMGPILAAGPIAEALGGKTPEETAISNILEEYGMPPGEGRELEERIHNGEIMVLLDDGK